MRNMLETCVRNMSFFQCPHPRMKDRRTASGTHGGGVEAASLEGGEAASLEGELPTRAPQGQSSPSTARPCATPVPFGHARSTSFGQKSHYARITTCVGVSRSNISRHELPVPPGHLPLTAAGDWATCDLPLLLQATCLSSPITVKERDYENEGCSMLPVSFLSTSSSHSNTSKYKSSSLRA